MSIHQISVFLENRPGQLAEITHLLADNGINLRAISIAEATEYGVLRIIADNAERATAILLENGNVLSMTPVIVVSVPDQPAGLSEILALLADGDVDISYMYSLFTHQDGKAYMVFRVADEAKFLQLLQTHDITPATTEELGLN